MNDYKIPLSSTPVRRYIVLSGVLLVFACAIITFYFNYAVSFEPEAQQFVLRSLWIGMGLIWLIAVLVTIEDYLSKSYVLTEEALSIRKNGWFGRGTERLYRYDTIMAVNINSRDDGAYGSIELILDQQAPVILSGVALPDEHARRIKMKTLRLAHDKSKNTP